MSINQINKDLEHSEIDTDFFLHNDLGFRPPVSSVQDQSSHSGMMGPPPPLPPPPPPPPSAMSNTPASSINSSMNNVAPGKMGELNFDMIEQLINEQQQSEQDKTKYSSSVKRYDPKYRALTEAFRMDQQEEQKLEPVTTQQQQQQQQQQQPQVCKSKFFSEGISLY